MCVLDGGLEKYLRLRVGLGLHAQLAFMAIILEHKSIPNGRLLGPSAIVLDCFCMIIYPGAAF